MSIEFIWQLPTGGDGRHGAAGRTRRGERRDGARPPFGPGVTDPRGDRFNYFDYLHQVARAADLGGFDGVRVQSDLEGDESWIVAGYLARGTRHVRLIAEFEASWGSAVYAAKNAVSFQRASGGRFAWQLGPGPDAAVRRRHGDTLPDTEVPARIEEFLTVARGVQTGAPYSFKGRYFEVRDGGFRGPLGGNPLPRIYLSGGGANDALLQVAARQADVHVFDAALATGPVEALRAALDRLRALAGQAGREVAAGLRLDLLARESEDEALQDATRYWEQTGQAAGAPRHAGLWPNAAGARSDAGAILVGSYEQVAAQLAAYADAGVASFVLGATPHLEEAYRIGEHVLPLLRARLPQDAPKAA